MLVAEADEQETQGCKIKGKSPVIIATSCSFSHLQVSPEHAMVLVGPVVIGHGRPKIPSGHTITIPERQACLLTAETGVPIGDSIVLGGHITLPEDVTFRLRRLVRKEGRVEELGEIEMVHIPAGSLIVADRGVLWSTLPAMTVLRGGTKLPSEFCFPSGTVLPAGTVIPRGTVFPSQITDLGRALPPSPTVPEVCALVHGSDCEW
ncbi:hypothetical protein MN608_05666 [Microdochium nivale]|nr:hypothetical protein MN608_05666 [Microdochium nivale]